MSVWTRFAARWALDLMRVMLPANLHGIQDLGVDGRMIASAALVSVITAFSVALVPAARLAGRTFNPRDDAKAPRVVIVSSAYARNVGVVPHLLVGRPVQVQTSRGFVGAAPPPDAWAEVVGVVDDLRIDSPQAELRPLAYVPLAQEVERLGASGVAIIRVQGDPSDVASRIPGVAKRVDEGVPLFNVQTLDDRLAALLGERVLAGRTMTIFAAVALTLSFLGVYGVLAHSVQSRLREFGIRLAIGATPAAVQRNVLLDGLRYGLIGVAIGAASSWAVSKYALTAVPGLTQSPPSTTLLLAAGLLALSLTAAWVPAARAATVDPVQTLRRE